MPRDTTDALADRHVVVVGGSSGIGLAVAQMAATRGARLTLMARSAERLAAAAELVGGAQVRTLDLRQPETVAAAARALGEVDHLVITAGEYAPARLADSQPAGWRALVEERLVGPLSLIRDVAPRITSSIVVFSGTVARRPLPGSVWHSLAAAGMEAAVRALAVELAPVRVNAIAPGAIDTPMLDRVLGAQKAERTAAMAARLPARRVGSSWDAAEAVLFVMTNAFMTGATVQIDGGSVLV
jgi:NAD(P)-dependent dehydrogenase (short-subunit alcohol dehydrogenase family)